MTAAEASAPEIERDCPACGSHDYRTLPHYSRGNWRMAECAACGFVYLKNVPDYARLTHEFAWEKTWAAEKVRRKEERSAIRALDKATAFRWKFRPDTGARYRRLFGAGKVLDVGCGRGNALPEPIVPFGIELSAGLQAESDPKFRARGGYVLHGPAIERLADFDEGFFDGVLMSSILEHEMDPKALLAGVRRVLKPGGILYLKLPNFAVSNRYIRGADWSGFRYPDHVNYFRPKDLERMAKEAGFAFRRTNALAPFADNMHALLTRPA